MPSENPAFLPIDEVHRDPAQPRSQFDPKSQKTLVENCREQGILQPIRVRWVCDRWVLVDGERRWLAAKEAGLAHVPVIVETRDLSDADVILQQMSANLVRADLDLIDRGLGYQSWLRKSGQPASKLALLIGVSESTISKSLAILTLPADDQQRVRDGTLSFGAAYRLVCDLGKSVCPPAVIPARRAARVRPKTLRVRLAQGVSLLLGSGARASLDQVSGAVAALLVRLNEAQARGVSGLAAAFLGNDKSEGSNP